MARHWRITRAKMPKLPWFNQADSDRLGPRVAAMKEGRDNFDWEQASRIEDDGGRTTSNRSEERKAYYKG